MIKRIRCGAFRILFWSLLLLAVSVTGLRLILAELNVFKIEIEAQLSQQLGAQVKIAQLRGGLNVFKPKLALYGVSIQSLQNKEALIQLKEIHLGIDLLATFKHPLLESLRISIIGAELSIERLKSGVIAIQGLPNIDHTRNPTWLMQGRHYQLLDSNIYWHDKKRNADPIQLRHVNISIDNMDQQHKIFIAMDLPETLGHSLTLAMDFTGDIFVPGSINAKLFAQGKNIQLEKIISGELAFDFIISKGRGDFSLWSHWEATQMTQMQGSIQMSDAEITDKQHKHFPIEQLDLQFELQKQKQQQQWHLGILNSHLKTRQTDLEIAQLAVALEQNKAGDLTHIALNCPQLDLGRLNKIITGNIILPEKLQKHLQNLAIEGQIEDLLFISKPQEESFSISTQLNQIRTKASTDLPGITGLSLYINGTSQQGDIQLSSQQLNFNAPGLFRNPLYFNHILGELHWQQLTDHWILSSPMLELETADIKTRNRLTFTLPKDKQPTSMSLQSHFYDIHDASRIPDYLPVGAIDDNALIKWVDHAFLAGKIEQGGLLFFGELNDYPFTQSKGVIELLFNAKNVDFHYADDWHLVENLAAEVRFFAESLEVNIHHGLANQASIKQASIKIDSFTDSDTLSVKGDIQGNLTQAIDFLKQTPYQEQITNLNKLLDMQGIFSASIDLEVPLIDLPGKINMTLIPQNATVHINATDLSVTEINGTLNITEKEIVGENLSASILGYPVNTEIFSNEQETKVLVSGLADIPQLARKFPSPLWSYLSGTSHYQLHLNVPRDSHQDTELQLISDLEGIAIDFPPLSKSAGQVRPFSLDLSVDSLGIKALNINYKDHLIAANSLDINFKKILPHWQGLFHSPFANGSLLIPVDFNNNPEISLFCDTLNLSALERIHLKNQSNAIAIHDIPDIHLESDTTYWNNYNLGRLTLLTEASTDGIHIKQLKITSANNNLDLSGDWSNHLSNIKGSLFSSNLGHLLQQLELSKNITDSAAEFQFSLNWPGTAMDFSSKTLSGDIQAQLKNGRILGIEPGLGRVLGALDTQKLFKRLRFDFSDITQEGLSFSEITTDISINQGLAKTNNFNINAMPAKINLAGTAILPTKEVDLLATILPKFPIAGTIMGSIANTVTKTVVGSQHAGGVILSLLYKITGTWEQPEVKRQFSPALTLPVILPEQNNNPATSLSKFK